MIEQSKCLKLPTMSNDVGLDNQNNQPADEHDRAGFSDVNAESDRLKIGPTNSGDENANLSTVLEGANCAHEGDEAVGRQASGAAGASGGGHGDSAVAAGRQTASEASGGAVGDRAMAAPSDARRKRSLPKRDGRRSRFNSDSLGPGGDFDERQVTSTDEAGIERETESVVHSFFVASQLLDQRHEMCEADDHPLQYDAPSPTGAAHIPELNYFASDQKSPTVVIGRRLAHLGDEFQQQYQTELDDLVHLLLPRILSTGDVVQILSDAYDAFRGVALQIFADGIGWGRVISLLAFGYRMSVALFTRGVRGFVASVIGLVVRFIVGERIARWIAQQGGWAMSFDYRLDDLLPGGWFGTALRVAYQLFTTVVIVAFVYNFVRRNTKHL